LELEDENSEARTGSVNKQKKENRMERKRELRGIVRKEFTNPIERKRLKISELHQSGRKSLVVC